MPFEFDCKPSVNSVLSYLSYQIILNTVQRYRNNFMRTIRGLLIAYLPTFGLELSTFGLELSTFGLELSTFGLELSTFGLELSTFDGASLSTSIPFIGRMYLVPLPYPSEIKRPFCVISSAYRIFLIYEDSRNIGDGCLSHNLHHRQEPM